MLEIPFKDDTALWASRSEEIRVRAFQRDTVCSFRPKDCETVARQSFAASWLAGIKINFFGRSDLYLLVKIKI